MKATNEKLRINYNKIAKLKMLKMAIYITKAESEHVFIYDIL